MIDNFRLAQGHCGLGKSCPEEGVLGSADNSVIAPNEGIEPSNVGHKESWGPLQVFYGTVVACWAMGEWFLKFIHTSDWHLGRIFYGVRLTDDQAYVLDQFVDLVRDESPDAVVIAGDIYDRSAPPVEAVQLLDETLSRIVLELEVPVVMIAGNHDSPERLSFGSSLMQAKGLHIIGLPDSCAPIEIHDEHGPVWFVPIPYAEPAVVREMLHVPDARNHDAAIRAQLEAAAAVAVEEGIEAEASSCKADDEMSVMASLFDEPADVGIDPYPVFDGVRTVAIAHAFVSGGTVSESERPLSVGGSGVIDISHFLPFTYTALGHLHRAQTMAQTAVRYSGSLLKYSFDEADHSKSVTVVEMGAEGTASVRTVPLAPRRDVRKIEGRFEEVMRGPGSDGSKEDYISVCLTDREAIWDAMNRLRAVYPNVMQIVPSEDAIAGAAESGLAAARVDHRKVTDLELFCDFYAQVTGEKLSDREEAAFVSILERAQAEKEAAAS
jgi:exonuclease SbcD